MVVQGSRFEARVSAEREERGVPEFFTLDKLGRIDRSKIPVAEDQPDRKSAKLDWWNTGSVERRLEYLSGWGIGLPERFFTSGGELDLHYRAHLYTISIIASYLPVIEELAVEYEKIGPSGDFTVIQEGLDVLNTELQESRVGKQHLREKCPLITTLNEESNWQDFFEFQGRTANIEGKVTARELDECIDIVLGAFRKED